MILIFLQYHASKMMNLDILFLGKLFPKEKETELKKKMKSGMQDAANALQWNIIDGLDANDCGTIKILDYLPVNSYPKGYEDSYISEFVFQHTNKYQSNDKIVGCTNLTIIKQFVNGVPFRKEVKWWAFDGEKRKKIMIIYTASSMFLSLAKYVKKINPDIMTCCIIADLPEFISARKLKGIRKIFNDVEARKSASLYKYIDQFVLLTEQMAHYLKINVPYMVMEGIAPKLDSEVDETVLHQFKGEKYILYTGTLNYEFGIKTLIEAFSLISDKNLKLVICGFGEAEKEILELNDSRIVYLGKIDRKQALVLQRNAIALINPRQNIEEFTKYSFPSKTMEYLASGAMVIAYKLDGIPDEYDKYINYVPDNSPKALAETIMKVISKSELERRKTGIESQKFVQEKKSYVAQSKRILEFLNQNR